MTIDQRLERLTERHEALTLSVELMVAENRERDRKWDEKWSQWDKRLGTLVGTVDRLVGVVENVAQVAASHERRLKSLEKN